MRTPNDEELLPELPPMADDGSTGTGEDGVYAFDIETGDPVGLDDRAFDGDDFGDPLDDDETSWLGGEALVLDLGGDETTTSDQEEGWLDDRPIQNIDVGLDAGEDRAPEGPDAGLEGIDDPVPVRRRSDDDTIDLPPLAPGTADGPEPEREGVFEIDMREPDL